MLRAMTHHNPAPEICRLSTPYGGFLRRVQHIGRNWPVLLALPLLVLLATGGHAIAKPLRIVAFGDSLTAGYGLPQVDAFPVVLEKALKARGYAVEIVNAGVSGDTTSGGLARLAWSVPDGTDAVILELGANDALRGMDPTLTRNNLDQIVSRLKDRNIPVLIAGMLAPRNLGTDYTRAFDSIFPEIAAKHGAPLYPFFLDGVIGNASLSLPDGIHPNAEGVRRVVERILPSVEDFIRSVAAKT
jgi:acyl-CoA thioesterase-1